MSGKCYRIYTCISDCGDGSSVVRYFKTLDEAERQAEKDLEYGPEGEAGYEDFKIIDGVLQPLGGFDVVDD